MKELEDERFIQLTTALQYDSYGEKYLTDFDRMFIHLERSAILNNRQFYQTETLEEKIQIKLNYINKVNWESPF